jgi:ABC-2 type transport system ATP-binding protein
VAKAFAGHVAVADLDLDIPRGSVFGLLGPNGAGKTTSIRMILNILAPDSGRIVILGRPPSSDVRDRVGYMPEERGLYPRMVLEEQLLFLAEMKGMRRAVAAKKMTSWLNRLGLADWRKRKVNELSKGMQQKAQLIATFLHDPEILILDEPMSGLDPVAADNVRDVILDLGRQGKTIVLSSHQMETVERICDRVALINKGRKVLDGEVRAIKAQRGKNTAVLAFEGDGSFLKDLPGVRVVRDFGRYSEIRMQDGADPITLLPAVVAHLRVSRFEVVEPSLHQIFVETVGGETAEENGAAS